MQELMEGMKNLLKKKPDILGDTANKLENYKIYNKFNTYKYNMTFIFFIAFKLLICLYNMIITTKKIPKPRTRNIRL